MKTHTRLLPAGRFALLAFFAFATFDSAGQWRLGITGGANINRAQTASAMFNFFRVASASGNQLGLRLEKDQRNRWLTWVGNFHFIQKGDRTERTGRYEEYFVQLHRNYLQTDGGAVASAGGTRLNVYGGVSAYAGYWVTGATSFRDGSIGRITPEEMLTVLDEKTFTFDVLKKFAFPTEAARVPYEFDSSFEVDHRRDNRWDVGVTARAGLRYTLNRITALAEYSYSHGLLNLERFKGNFSLYQLRQVNRTHRFELGLLYSF